MILGDLSPTEIDALLASERIAHLAFEQYGQPYVLPIAYAYDGEAIYVHSLEGSKIQMMRAHPQVCVQVDQIENMMSWKSAMAEGVFQELRGDAAKAALRRLIDRLAPGATSVDPFAPPGLEERVVMFRVQLTARSGRFARS